MDLAETVDDLICIFDSAGDTTMDTLAMFVFGWILVALFLLWLGKFIYNRFIVKGDAKSVKTSDAAKVEPPISADTVDSDKKAVSGAVTSTAAATVSSGRRSSGGRTVGATPPVRRRLTRQSPAPEVKRTKFIQAPTTTGSDNISVLWVNDVFQWLYNDLVILNELLSVWMHSLNEYSKKSVAEEGIGIEFVRILPETHPPSISNVFSECASNDDVQGDELLTVLGKSRAYMNMTAVTTQTITCDCEATPAFQLKCFREKGEKTEVSHYRVNVNRFRARLNIFCVSEKLQADVKCDGWPEIKIGLAPVGNIKNNLDETQLQDLISEIVSTALRSTEVHLNLAAYPTCPRLVRHIEMPGRMHYDGQGYTSTPSRLPGEKRLLVKIVKAAQLAEGCTEPFCVVEMDEPPQKNQTGIQKRTDSPTWDEHFLFDLTPNTAELLFEIYDHAKNPHKFLGLGIVGVEELLINPSQRQIISLQSRPYESDPVSGTLTVEFQFIEGPNIPNMSLLGGQPYRIKESIRSISPGSPTTKLTTTTTTFHNENLLNGNHLANTAMREIDSLSNANKTTLTIHSVVRQPSQRLVKVECTDDGTWKEIERVETSTDETSLEDINGKSGEVDKVVEAVLNVTETTEINAETNGKINTENGVTVPTITNGTSTTENGDKPLPGDISKTNTLQSQASTQDPTNPDYRGRTKKRRDFFGTIKRRLKGRSKSAGPGEDENGRDDSLNRSISADRSRGNDDSFRLNVPGSGRNELETSRRSSISEASGLSSASTRTYINEASTLVLETVENGIKKHYLIPLSLAQKSKWRKKGTKLHIFNDHTFVAKHLSGNTICQVCAKALARRIGKQGYECRDCQLKCHKHCHVKTNDNCPTSTIHNIELNYIQNPYTDKNIRML